MTMRLLVVEGGVEGIDLLMIEKEGGGRKMKGV